ncbi:MAG: hypothetical protein LQ350_003992 [Teloschistes chrysophthalmus]|nr:MAG: hypothetical protein LQ350_003992 [Niorma chrysophthalma]
MPPSESRPSDTSFRKTWDKAEYAQKAADREARIKEEGKARAEAKAAGKKYHPPRASTPPDAKETVSRAARLDVSANVGKTTLVPAGASTGKRGRSAGFYCPDCDLTFKDNLQFVDHLNSKQHLSNTGQTGEVKRATVEEVRERLEWLARRKREEAEKVADTVVELGARLEKREEEMEAEREEKRRKRREKRRKTEGGVGVKEEVVEGNGIIC